MFNFFQRKKNPLAEKFRQLAGYAKQMDAEKEQELLEQIFRLHWDELKTIPKFNIYPLFQVLCDTLSIQKIFEEKMKEMIGSIHPNRPYCEKEFISTALYRLSFTNRDLAIELARQWSDQNKTDRDRLKILRIVLIHARDFSEVAKVSRRYFETDEDEFILDERGYHHVFDPEGEHEYVRSERCECGNNSFEYTRHTSRLDEGLSKNDGLCSQCKKEKSFIFSVANRTHESELEKMAKKFGLS